MDFLKRVTLAELQDKLADVGLSYTGEKIDLAARLFNYHSKHSKRAPALYTVVELQTKLQKRGMSPRGNKDELIARLIGFYCIFTLFSKPPIELRKMIWEQALPGERGLRVSRIIDVRKTSLFGWSCTDGLLELLHACKESRDSVLQHYMISAQNLQQSSLLVNISKDLLWFNYWSRRSSSCNYGQRAMRHFTRLAFSVGWLLRELDDTDHAVRDGLYDIISACEELQEIRILRALFRFESYSMKDNARCEDARVRLRRYLSEVGQQHPDRKALDHISYPLNGKIASQV